MKITRDLLVLICSLTMVTVLGGCADGGNNQGGGGTDADDLRIVMITNEPFDPPTLTRIAGAESKSEELGVDFSWQAPETIDAASQTALLQQVATTSPDGIIMSAVDANALVEPMKSVMELGIPIMTVDADVNDEEARLGTVRTSEVESGHMAADYASDVVGAKGVVGYVGYTPGIQSIDTRNDAWNEGIDDSDGIVNAGDEYAGADVQENVQKTSALISREPELDLIFASWTNAAIGAAQAVEQSGRDITVIGGDAAPEQVEQLEQGLVDSLIVQKQFDMGELGVESLVNYVVDDVEPRSEVLLDAVVATQDNMNDEKVSQYFYTYSSEDVE